MREARLVLGGSLMAMTWFQATAAAFSVCVGFVGCGGSSSSVPGGGDASVDAATDAAQFETGADSGPTSGDDASGDDSPVTVEAGSDGGCGGASASCRTCCRTEHTKGYDTLVVAEYECACKPGICGAVDGGAIDAGSADASTLGTGACANECATKSTPGAACDACLVDSVGTMASPGPCYADVSKACQADTDCTAYVTCLQGCP